MSGFSGFIFQCTWLLDDDIDNNVAVNTDIRSFNSKHAECDWYFKEPELQGARKCGAVKCGAVKCIGIKDVDKGNK
jgi:hypothetical protein